MLPVFLSYVNVDIYWTTITVCCTPRAVALLYMAAVAGAFLRPWIAWTIYVTVALLWFVPDRRIERVLMREAAAGG